MSEMLVEGRAGLMPETLVEGRLEERGLSHFDVHTNDLATLFKCRF